MKKSNRLLIFLLTILILLTPISSSFADESLAKEGDNIVGFDENVDAYFIGEEDSGDVFYQKNADKAYPIASMSKLMTYYIVREAIDNNILSFDDKIKGTKEAEELTGPGYSYLGIKEGEEYSVKELLRGLIVVSGNDCANLLATKLAGSEKEFANMMNQKASELGLSSQKFFNASGLNTEDDKQNMSSAKDLFELVRIILEKYPEILEYSKIRKIDDDKKDIHQDSTIPLVEEIDGVDGLKTGTTEEAGYCLTTTVDMSKLDKKNEFRTIGIVMGAENKEVRDSVMTDLIYYVSRYFDYRKLTDVNKPVKSVRVNSAKEGYVELYPDKDVGFIVKDKTMPSIKYDIDQNIKAPIKKGENYGKAYISYKGEDIEVDLLSKKDQNKASDFTRVKRSIADACDFLLECIIAR